MIKPLQVWAGDDDNDDWHCVQTLDESNKYITISLFSHALSINPSSLPQAVNINLTRFNLIMMLIFFSVVTLLQFGPFLLMQLETKWSPVGRLCVSNRTLNFLGNCSFFFLFIHMEINKELFLAKFKIILSGESN